MTIVDMKCVVCGAKFQDELAPYLNGKLEVCKSCRRQQEINRHLKNKEK